MVNTCWGWRKILDSFILQDFEWPSYLIVALEPKLSKTLFLKFLKVGYTVHIENLTFILYHQRCCCIVRYVSYTLHIYVCMCLVVFLFSAYNSTELWPGDKCFQTILTIQYRGFPESESSHRQLLIINQIQSLHCEIVNKGILNFLNKIDKK